MQTLQKPAAHLIRRAVFRPTEPVILSHYHGPRSYISRIIPSSVFNTTRHKSTANFPQPPIQEETTLNPPTRYPAPHRNPDEPIYHLHFTCKVCKHRTAHTVSKQGYHSGTVLIQCPGCKERHLISDHLHIFSNRKITLEDILAEKGKTLSRGMTDSDGRIEFWKEDNAAGTRR